MMSLLLPLLLLSLFFHGTSKTPTSMHPILTRAEKCLECRSLIFGYSLFGLGYTPLEAASRDNLVEVVGALLEKGARVEGSRALHYASYYGYREVLDKILTKRPDLVNSVDRSGRTPLHWAVSNGHANLVFHLLDRWKANLNIKDFDDYSPIDFARIKALWKIVDQLEEYRTRQQATLSS